MKSVSQRTAMFRRTASFCAVLAAIVSSPVQSQDTSPKPSPADLVDALKTMAGNPPHARANFAKGTCVRGRYVPAATAGRVTRSKSFTQASDVLARFSVSSGNPHVADTNKGALRGLSLHLGTESNRSDLLLENAPVHFARDLAQMLASLKARTAGPDGKLDPQVFKDFGAANPEALNQAHFVGARQLPGSWAGTFYWGVHAFPATNNKGEIRFIKFKVVPLAGEITLNEEEAKTHPNDFLRADLAQRLSSGSVRFDVLAILDQPGDQVMDTTQRWTDEDKRETVRLGTLSIIDLAPDGSCDGDIFNPARLADGIGLPKDEIFAARAPAYAISLGKRLN